MIGHAPEPWDINPYVDAIDIVDANGVVVAHMADRTIDLAGMPPENARRIRDAVNACEGLSDEQVAAVKRLIAWFTVPNPGVAEEEEYWELREIFPKWRAR